MIKKLFANRNHRRPKSVRRRNHFHFENLEVRRLLAGCDLELSGSIAGVVNITPTTTACLMGDITIEPGAELNIQGGGFLTTEGDYDIEVFGSFSVESAVVDFQNNTNITVKPGGSISWLGGTFNGDSITLEPSSDATFLSATIAGEEVDVQPGSRGVFQANDFQNDNLNFFSNDVDLINNTFFDTTPVTTNPSLTYKVDTDRFGNIYQIGSYVAVEGEAVFNNNWLPIDNVIYEIRNNKVTIPEDIVIFITPGVTVDSSSALSEIEVEGKLFAYDSDFIGTNTYINVQEDGNFVMRQDSSISGFRVEFNEGSTGSVAGNRLFDVDLVVHSELVAVNNNDFFDTTPVATLPSIVPTFQNNTFNALNSQIFVHGTATRNTSWAPIPNVASYTIVDDVTIPLGVNLAAYAGVNIDTANSLSSINIGGSMFAFGVDFIGTENELLVHTGGRLSMGNGTTVAGDRVVYERGAFGNVVGVDFLTAKLEWFSPQAFLNNNSFSNTNPIEVEANLVPNIQANQFAPNTVIDVGGFVSSDLSWPNKTNVLEYSLVDDVFVEPGATLALNNVQIRSDMDTDFLVAGTLTTFDATFLGDDNDETQFVVYSGGQLDLRFDTSVAGDKITYLDGSSGTIDFSNLDLNEIEIHDQSTAVIRFNSFMTGMVTAVGNNANTIPFRNMFWGTTDLTEIEDRITHQVDDPSLPLVEFEPFLVSPPTGPGLRPVIAGAPHPFDPLPVNTVTPEGRMENRIKFKANQRLILAGSQETLLDEAVRDTVFASLEIARDHENSLVEI